MTVVVTDVELDHTQRPSDIEQLSRRLQIRYSLAGGLCGLLSVSTEAGGLASRVQEGDATPGVGVSGLLSSPVPLSPAFLSPSSFSPPRAWAEAPDADRTRSNPGRA